MPSIIPPPQSMPSYIESLSIKVIVCQIVLQAWLRPTLRSAFFLCGSFKRYFTTDCEISTHHNFKSVNYCQSALHMALTPRFPRGFRDISKTFKYKKGCYERIAAPSLLILHCLTFNFLRNFILFLKSLAIF